MKNRIPRRDLFSRSTWVFLLFGLLFLPAASYAQEIQVDSADPSSAEQGTYDLEVTVTGDNFGSESEVDFYVTGTGVPGVPADPGGITVKNVKRRGPKTLKVTIDVAPDAVVDKFDIEVRSRGRTGKGTELFRVLKKTEWVWEVYMPGAGTGYWNLYPDGYPEGKSFQNSDIIYVSVDKTRGTLHTFKLAIMKDRNNDEKIGFQNLVLTPRTGVDTSGNAPCNFPTNSVPCEDLDDDDPVCIEYFLENHPHPYTDLYDDSKDYELFWLSVEVDYDIESMNPSETLHPSGNVHIEVVKTDDVLADGCRDFHTVVAGRDVVEASQVITIRRPTENSWEITVDTADGKIHFAETYWGYRGQGKGKIVSKKPVRAEGPFKLTATWTRY